jgi:hypothetical protein
VLATRRVKGSTSTTEKSIEESTEEEEKNSANDTREKGSESAKLLCDVRREWIHRSVIGDTVILVIWTFAHFIFEAFPLSFSLLTRPFTGDADLVRWRRGVCDGTLHFLCFCRQWVPQAEFSGSPSI